MNIINSIIVLLIKRKHVKLINKHVSDLKRKLEINQRNATLYYKNCDEVDCPFFDRPNTQCCDDKDKLNVIL